VSVFADASQEEVDAADSFDLGLVLDAFNLKIWGIAVEDMDVIWVDVDVREEVPPHEGVVALGMVSGETDVLVLLPVRVEASRLDWVMLIPY